MTKEAKTQTTQEPLKGGQESPDMAEFRKQWRQNGLLLDLIGAIGAVSTQMFFINQELSSLTETAESLIEEVRSGNKYAADISAQLHDERIRPSDEPAASFGTSIGLVADAMTAFHNGDAEVPVKGAVHVTNDNLDHLERIADNLSTEDGFSVASALDEINDNIKLVADPAEDGRLRIYADGDIMNHPY